MAKLARNFFQTGSFKGDTRDAGRIINVMARGFEGMAKEIGTVLTKEILGEIGDKLVENSRELTPIDTSALEQSIKNKVSETGRGKATVTVSAGGSTPITGKNSPTGFVGYGLLVHEDLEGTVKQDGARGPKFLTRGLNKSIKDIEQILQGKIKGFVK